VNYNLDLYWPIKCLTPTTSYDVATSTFSYILEMCSCTTKGQASLVLEAEAEGEAVGEAEGEAVGEA